VDDKELLDYIISILPAHPGCVAMSQFHSLFMNIVLPAYAQLRDGQAQLLQEQSGDGSIKDQGVK